MDPPEEKANEGDSSPGADLANCLMSQYGATFLGVSGSTAYALVKKPPNALSKMILAGTAGATLDIFIGWYSACTTEVELYNQHQDRMLEQKMLEYARNHKDGRDKTR